MKPKSSSLLQGPDFLKEGLDESAVPDRLVKSHQPNFIQYDSEVNQANSQNYFFNVFKLTMEA
jgi:hypothetical protein